MKNIIKKIYSNPSAACGIVGISIMLCVIVLFTLQQRREEGQIITLPKELQRESTIESILSPKDAISYFIQAVGEDDLDKGLRGFPIDERCYGMQPFQELRKGEVDWDVLPVLAGDFTEYMSLASAELTGSYVTMFENWKAEYSKLKKPAIEGMIYLYPVKSDSEYTLKADRLSEMWSIEQLCELEVILESEGQNYVSIFTLADYGQGWKVFSVGNDINNLAGGRMIRPLESGEIMLKDSEAEQRNVEKSLLGNYEKKEVRQNAKDVKKLLESKDALLPANYYVVYPNRKETPEQVITQFVRCLQRKDFVAALGYGVDAGEYVHVEQESLLEQGEFAKQLKLFLYDVMLQKKKFPEELTKKEAEEILEELNPQYCFDIEIGKIEKDKKSNKYLMSYAYGRKLYQAEFEVVENTSGWQIQSMGDVKKVKE